MVRRSKQNYQRNVWVAGGDWCAALSYSCAIVTCSLWSQDLCVCHLATNLLPGYNTPFLIIIGSHTGPELKDLYLWIGGRGGMLQDVSIQKGCQETALQQTKRPCGVCWNLALFLTDTTVVGACTSTFTELCHVWMAQMMNLEEAIQRLFFFSSSDDHKQK